MGVRAAKDALFDAFAEVAKALASGRRAEIVDVLAQGERSVEQIAAEIDQSGANTSHHVRAMARAGVLRTRREWTRIVYMLVSDRIGDMSAAMRDVAAEHVAGINELADAYVGDRSALEPVSGANSKPVSRPETSSYSTSAPPSNTKPATSPAPDRSRLVNCAVCVRWPRTPRLLPTAAARTACTPTRPYANCAGATSPPSASKTDTPNGNEPACPSRSEQEDDHAP